MTFEPVHVPPLSLEAYATVVEPVHIPPLSLEAYATVAGDEAIEEIRALAEPLRGARVLHVSSTKFGGGVAEILPTLTALLRDAGLEAEWRVILADEEFFRVTKAIHNGLQGMQVVLSPEDRAAFGSAQQRFATALEGTFDFVVVHDPQPVGLRSLVRRKEGHWIWRCHLDLTASDDEMWSFVGPWVEPYEAAVFTLPSYVRPDLGVGVVAIIHPCIDPLSPKNLSFEPHLANDVVYRFGVDPHRPLLLQVSRFDPWKDPKGVIDVYHRVKRDVPDVQLALIGSMATDDPEGWRIYRDILRFAGSDEDLLVLSNLDGVGALEVNAFQRASEVVLQKSIREGFGLTVSEAMWKGIPVVGGRVGGIPLQIGENAGGRLVESVDAATEACLELLADPSLRHNLGHAGRERVRRYFLSTRNMRDYLRLFTALRTGDRTLVPAGLGSEPGVVRQ
jgi:trehalose synthase